jgi:hypothetical protein
VFEMQRIATQDQAVEVRGKVFKQEAVSIWRVHFEVLPSEAEPRLRLTLKEVQHKLKGATGAAVEHTLAEKLQGRQFTLKVSTHGRIQGLEGYADFVTAASENQPERARSLRTLLPEDGLKEAFADFLGPLPDVGVRPGDTWQRPVREPIPHFGSLDSSWQFAAQGPTTAGYHLAYTIKTNYRPPTSDDAPLFRIVKGALHGENGRGKIVFDAERGRLLLHERHITVRGTLTVEMMGMQVPLEFASENKVEIRSK